MTHLLSAVVGSLLAIPAPAASPFPSEEARPVIRQVYLMGTRCTLTAWSADPAAGARKLEGLVRLLEETEAELSTWRPDTPLSAVNRHPQGEPLELTPSLCRLWEDLLSWSESTGFAFDPAIGTLIDTWELRTGGRIPSGEELERARENAGMRHFAFDPKVCSIARQADAWMDSGAFAKGEALDRALRAQDDDGAIPWMIDLGGQLAVNGRLAESGTWKAYISHPERRDEPLLSVEFDSGSLATSGSSERDLAAAGERVGHILDPRSGRPAAFRGSVTIWHESALAADILSTALYVMGPGPGLAWANARGIAACYLTPVAGGIQVRTSSAFPPVARTKP